MSIRHYDLLPDPEIPFKNCKLGREKYAEVLTSIVHKYADGFVLAINNEWGTGKTTFVKMWRQYLEINGFKTLYYNAWENDFEPDPLIAIISELEELKDEGTEKTFKTVLEKAAPLAKSLIQSFVKHQIEKNVGSEVVKGILNLTAEATSEEMEAQIKAYTSKKNSIAEFKNSLEKFVNESTDDKPVVFIIDEMDRCRPSYAVEVLEQIKHLFNVPGIAFVLSVDKVQLGHAIRGFYGSDNIDAEEYLRRFIDVEYSLPNPESTVFTEYLYGYFKYDSFFVSKTRLQYRTFVNDERRFLEFSNFLFTQKSLTLRLHEKIISHTRIALSSFHPNQYVFPGLLLFLVYLKYCYSHIYKHLQNFEQSYQSIINKLEEPFISNISESSSKYFLLVEAQLITFYHNSCNKKSNYSSHIIERDEQNNKRLTIETKIKFENANENLLHYVENVSNNVDCYGLGLEFFLNRINLTEPMKI